MRALEFSDGSKQALGLVFASPDVGGFLEEMREAKAALLEWRETHGEACRSVMFTITAPLEHHEAIEAALDHVYEEEGDLSPLLHSLRAEAAFLNPSGRAIKEYSLRQPPEERQVKSRPWWKFW